MLETSQIPKGILPQRCLPPWLLARHQDGAHGVFPWLCLRKQKWGKESEPRLPHPTRSDCRNLPLG
jgi:hypothetical protein